MPQPRLAPPLFPAVERTARLGAAALAFLGLMLAWWLPLPADAAGTLPHLPPHAPGAAAVGESASLSWY